MVEEESDLKITYIGHSGFLVEMPECCFLFDYYSGSFSMSVVPDFSIRKEIAFTL